MNKIGSDSMVDEGDFVDINGSYDDVSGLQGDIDGELDQILTDFDGGDLNDVLEVRVYRPMEGKGKVAYVFACLPTELPILDKLRDEYGGGDFEVRLLKNKRIFRKFQVCVEAPVKAPSVQGHSESAGLAGVMAEGFTRLGELMVQMNTNSQPTQPPVDMMTMQTGMMQQMVAMKEFVGGGQRQPDPLKQMAQLMELKKAFSDTENEKESGTNDVLVALINNVMPVLGKIGEADSKVVAKVPGERADKGNAAPIEPSKEIKAMKLQLMYLCSMAKKNVDPAPYALMVLDNTPEENLASLLEFVSGDNAIEEMARVHKDVEMYPMWFKELGKLVVEYAELELDEDGNLTEEDERAKVDAEKAISEHDNVSGENQGGSDLNDPLSNAEIDSFREGWDYGDSEDNEGVGKEG